MVFIPLFQISSDFISWVFIMINLVLVFALFPSNYKLPYKNIILLAFTLRVILIVLNVLTGVNDSISGDALAFHDSGVDLSQGGSYSKGTYSYFLGFLYSLIGPRKIVAEYLNVLLGLGAIIGLARIVDYIGISQKGGKLVIVIISFSLFCMLYDSSLLRESWPRCFIAWSIYYFIRWFDKGKLKYSLLTVGCVLAAAYMHSGTLFLLLGYLVAFATYSHKHKQGRLSFKSLVVIALIVGGGMFIFTFTDVFTAKIDQAVKQEAVEQALSNYARSTGRSAYLTNVNPENKTQIILYSPLKMFYFMFSPLPMDIGTALDVVAFTTDSMVYFLLLWFVFRNSKVTARSKTMIRYLSISLFFTVLVYGYGTWNSGTAIRHRAKLLPFILVMYAVTKREKERVKTRDLNMA